MEEQDTSKRRQGIPECSEFVEFWTPMSILEYVEATVGALLDVHPAYAVLDIPVGQFIQVMTNRDGSVRLESSASMSVIASNLGFTHLVENHEHIAAANIPVEWQAKEKLVAETVMRLVVDVHRVELPATFLLRMELVEAN